MATKVVCDICGREIQLYEPFFKITEVQKEFDDLSINESLEVYELRKMDVCKDCINKIKQSAKKEEE